VRVARFPIVPGFTIVEQLGRGGFAVVYRATQDQLGRQVALKILVGTEFDEEDHRRFRRECRALAEISWHPNVVQIFDAGVTDDGQPFLAMELMTGGALRLPNGQKMPAATVRKVGIEIADALHAAHLAGILHRDVKPDNILLDRVGNYRLADFGIAGVADGTRTGTGLFSGTIAFLAPEVLLGERATEASDVYSLGATLHTLLSGIPPFARASDSNVAASLNRILHEEPASVVTVGAPSDLAEAVQRAMAKDPTARFANASEFASALRATGSGWGQPLPDGSVAGEYDLDDPEVGATIPRARIASRAKVENFAPPTLGPQAIESPPTELRQPMGAAGTKWPEPPSGAPQYLKPTASRPQKSRRWIWMAVAAALVIAAVSLTVLKPGANIVTRVTTVAVGTPTTNAQTSAPTSAAQPSVSAAPASVASIDENLVVASDLPLQGLSADASKDTNLAMHLFLRQQNGKAGKFNITLKEYDNATAAKGGWDDTTCAKNAKDHVSSAKEVAVVGTYNSGCSRIEIPVLNQDKTGPMLMVSHANTNPGLTKKWDPGEPEKYYPTGKRNYGRVSVTDDFQGAAGAQFAAKELKVKKCLVLNDAQTYGVGVATAFKTEAMKQGITVVGDVAWDAKSVSYSALMEQYKDKVDCVYLGGINDNNGEQLVRDKVAVLGANAGAVKLVAPDGFTGYPTLLKTSESDGMYITFAGLPVSELIKAGGAGAKFVADFKAAYGHYPASEYAIYGAAALQYVMAAIAASDGSRAGVTSQALSGTLKIPGAQSLLGKEFSIDQTGAVNVRDISIQVVSGGRETFLKPWAV
jgi:branched-chain amino acid transport system substrate-binding protein